MLNKSKTRQQIKRILRESAVIVFSVLLALFANEWRSNVKEAQQTQTILNNIKLELKDNERIAQKPFNTINPFIKTWKPLSIVIRSNSFYSTAIFLKITRSLPTASCEKALTILPGS